MTNFNPSEITTEIAGLKMSFGELISDALKVLLESKHLYQSVAVDIKDASDKAISRSSKGLAALLEKAAKELPNKNFRVIDPAAFNRPILPGVPSEVSFVTPDVKLYCKTCQRIEAFNPLSSTNFLGQGSPATEYLTAFSAVQVFVFSFLCQSCKTIPEVFIVRRHGLKLTLCGRAPIEHVEVPLSIPKAVEQYYSGAIVAYQSGQSLAAIFLLRTLIEQWARCQSSAQGGPADAVLEEYMAGLPQDFKSRFKSWRELYGELSADIHSATGSSDLFERAVGQVSEHFEARRLYKLGSA